MALGYLEYLWDTSHHCPWKVIAHILQVFSTHTRPILGDKTRILFWEDLWWEEQPLCLQFPRISRVTTTKNLSISAILGNDTSMSWDLIFHHNLTDVETEDLERLMSLVSHVHLTPSIPDVKA